MKNNSQKKVFGIIAALAVLLMLVTVVGPVSAIELGNYHHIYVNVANDDGVRFNETGNNTYYVKYDGGGLNALHVTPNTGDADGDVWNSVSSTGTFYVSDTGGRGYDDDIILFFALNGTPGDEFSINIKSDGYQWTPTVDGSVPSLNPADHKIEALNETFYASDLIYGSQTWRPAGSEYPIFHKQNMSDTSNEFDFMFIDLNVGVVGNSNLIDGGMAGITYTINDYEGFAAFNAYAYCDQSNQGQGISWTNMLSADYGSSGLSLTL